MDYWTNYSIWRERRRELLREAQERQLEREARKIRAAFAHSKKRPGAVEVRWGLLEDEAKVAELLELNGMPRWVAYEERFVVAEKNGRMLGALRYRTEKERLLLGLLVVDPWAGEERVARALYAGAGDLARELGAGEVIASGARAGYSGVAGYGRWGRDWRLDATKTCEAGDRMVKGGWCRVISLFRELPVPFHRY